MMNGRRYAHHEQSETVQNEKGEWVNVYGRQTPQAGQRLPGMPAYPTVEEAVGAARERSRRHDTLEQLPSRPGTMYGQSEQGGGLGRLLPGGYGAPDQGEGEPLLTPEIRNMLAGARAGGGFPSVADYMRTVAGRVRMQQLLDEGQYRTMQQYGPQYQGGMKSILDLYGYRPPAELRPEQVQGVTQSPTGVPLGRRMF